jgi:hypothetical protein
MTDGLLVSMAMRYRHDFGLLSDNQKRSVLSQMRQIYEEVAGIGFYSPERESHYAAMYPHAREGGL